MIEVVLEFLNGRSAGAALAYSLLFPVYIALLVAVTLFPLKWFRTRGVIMAALLIAYLFINLAGESLSSSVERARMASNSSAIRMFIIASWFGYLFSVVYSAMRRNSVKREP